MSILSFTWRGESSDAHGVAVMRLPDIGAPMQRGTAYTVPGRDGTLFLPEGSLDELTLLAECYLPYEQGEDVSDMDTIRAWLSGEGIWTQSDLPGRAFRARITDAIAFSPMVPGFDDRLFGLTLYAEPYQYVEPAAEAAVLEESGTSLHNPGNASSRPRIAIAGVGEFVVSINSQVMQFSGVEGGIIVDSELMDCLNLDGVTLANGFAEMDDFPVLTPGGNLITWEGGVTRVEVLPRWRYR